MPEYIEREALKCENLEKYMTVMEVNTKEYGNQIVVAVDDLMYLPTADVAEVVRCKDCIYYRKMATGGLCMCGDKKTSYAADFYPKENDFCSYGEKKAEVKNYETENKT